MSEGETVNLDFNLLGRSSADVEFGFSDRPTAVTTDVDADPNAIPVADYTVNTGSPLTINAGGTGPAIVEIEAHPDSIVEEPETFELHVDYANNADADPDTVTVTITDASPRLFSVANPETTEGQPLVFTISLADGDTDPISGPVTVNFTISAPSSGGATEPDDYSHNAEFGHFRCPVMQPWRSSWPPCSTWTIQKATKRCTSPSITDQLPVVGFGTSKEIGVGTIRDVEPPVLSVGDATAEEGDDLEFVFTLNIPAVFDVTFDVCTYALRATAGLSANQNADYSNAIEDPNCEERTIDKGQGQHLEKVKTFIDFVLEPDENLQMRVENLKNARSAPTMRSVTAPSKRFSR